MPLAGVHQREAGFPGGCEDALEWLDRTPSQRDIVPENIFRWGTKREKMES